MRLNWSMSGRANGVFGIGLRIINPVRIIAGTLGVLVQETPHFIVKLTAQTGEHSSPLS